MLGHLKNNKFFREFIYIRAHLQLIINFPTEHVCTGVNLRRRKQQKHLKSTNAILTRYVFRRIIWLGHRALFEMSINLKNNFTSRYSDTLIITDYR